MSFRLQHRVTLLAFTTAVGVSLFSPLPAQIPGIPSLQPTQAAPAVETPEAAEARIQTWVKEARGAFARINDPEAEKNLPQGVTAAELLDYRRDLEQVILGVGRFDTIRQGMPEARRALENARNTAAVWKGFSEKPPFSMLMIDDLVNQRDAITEKSKTHNSSLQLFTRTLSNAVDELRESDGKMKELVALTAEDSTDKGPAEWRLEAARAKNRLLALRSTMLQANIALLRDQVESAKIQLELLDRQISHGRKKAVLSEDDLTKIKKTAEDRQAAVRKEGLAIRKRQEEAVTAVLRQKAAVSQLLKDVPAGTEPEPTPELQLARVKQEAAETRANSLQIISEYLDSIEQLDSYLPDGYQYRKAVYDAKSSQDRKGAMQNLQSSLDRLTAWETVLLNELAGVGANIGEQEARASLISSDDPRLIPLSDVRASLWEKQSVLQRLTHAVTAQRKMLARWVAEFEDPSIKKPFGVRLTEAKDTVVQAARNVWNFEVFQYTETYVSPTTGLPTPQQKGVPLGKIFIGVAFFVIGYLICLGIKNRLRNMVVRRGHIAEAQAKTISNWLMIVVGFLLLVATLHFLSIPLTIFAFFGGALAIGLGFGTQTLIKNFISGIIVLTERKIRVGDIVDVGGVSGSITEINTRSSVLKSADGKETLVPNSVFLETRITNLTLSNRKVRRKLTVGVALGTPAQAVSGIIKECVERHGLVLKDPEPIVTFEEFADSAHIFAAYYWTEFNDKTNGDVVASDIRFMIDKRFVEAGIRYPSSDPAFPIRTDQPLQFEWVGKPGLPGNE